MITRTALGDCYCIGAEPNYITNIPQTVKFGVSSWTKGNAPGRMGGTRIGPARLKRLDRGSELGARNTGWVARGSELGARRTVGIVAGGPQHRMGGTRLGARRTGGGTRIGWVGGTRITDQIGGRIGWGTW